MMPDRAGSVVLGIFPHPDDEAYAAGGVLADAAARGARVHVLCATRGERGQWFHRAGGERQALAAVRSAELTCACEALGIQPPMFLELQDGQIASVNFPTAVASIVQAIRRLRPDVVLSLGSDGVYGHPDHVALHRLVVAAVPSAAGGGRFPEDAHGTPHTVRRVLFAAFRPGHFRPQYDRMLQSDVAAQVRLIDPGRLGTGPAEIDVSVPISHMAQAKLAALACYRSQYATEDPRSIFPIGIVDGLLDVECFTVLGDRPGSPLADIFEGLAP